MTGVASPSVPRHAEIRLAPSLADQPVEGSATLPPLTTALEPGDTTITSMTLVLDDGAGQAVEATRLVEALPNLSALAVSVEGIRGGESLPTVLDLCRRAQDRDVACLVNVVLDEQADAFEATVCGSYMAVVKRLSDALTGAGIEVRWLVPDLAPLVYRLEPLFALAEQHQVEAILVPAPADGCAAPGRELSPDDSLFAWDFVTYRILGDGRASLSTGAAAFYRYLADAYASRAAADGSALPPPSALHRSVVALTPVPEREPAAWTLRQEQRLAVTLPADIGAAAAAEQSRIAHVADAAAVMAEGIRGGLQWLAARLARRPGLAEGDRLPRVLLIGAYGGEHIGDTAILGGVLIRLHEQFGTTEAVLVSQRPLHTRHLIPMLEVPVDVRVEPYDAATLRECVPQVDAVVFAGGPLIDLPKQLVKHLYAVSLGRRHGKPFLAEGIGPGPIIRIPSAWVARRLVKAAARISLRTSGDRQAAVMRGVECRVGRDPAFDYLETRGPNLTRLPERDAQAIDALLADVKPGAILIGLNVRPINAFYTAGATQAERDSTTRSVEDRFERQVAEAMAKLRDALKRDVRVVFFPMNAIQFGHSDLCSAYRIARHVPHGVDFRVWQADASLDGVLGLIRRLDAVVTMRFHATIFALSQQRPVVGIDYRVGRKDKVAALLDDFGKADDCCRIDELTADWLVNRVQSLLERQRGTSDRQPGGPADS